MKKNKRRIGSIVISLVISIIWYVSVNIAFTVPEIQWKYQNPNILVHFSEPLIAVDGFADVDNNPDSLQWELIEDAMVVGRRDEYVEISNKHQAYVDFEKTVLKDKFADGQRILSNEELYGLFIKLCNDEEVDIEFDEIPVSTFGILPTECYIVVKGRYEGSLALTTNRVLPERDTDISQVWNIYDNLPWLQILECIISTIIVFTTAIFILIKTQNNKIVISVLFGVMFLLIAFAFFYAQRMN